MDQDINKNYSQENGKRRRPPVRYDENGNPIWKDTYVYARLNS